MAPERICPQARKAAKPDAGTSGEPADADYGQARPALRVVACEQRQRDPCERFELTAQALGQDGREVDAERANIFRQLALQHQSGEATR